MKKDIFFQLSQNAAERLAERFGTPLLVLSLEQIEKNYRFLKKHLPRVQLTMRSRPIRISGSWNCCVIWVPALMLPLTARSELWQQWVLTASV